MKIVSEALSGRSPNRLLLICGSLLVGAFAAYECAQFVLTGSFMGIAFVALTLIGAVVAVEILNNWRNGVYFFLSWLLFEDFVRKFLGNNMAIYFAKDVLAAIVFISFAAAMRRKEVSPFRPPFLGPVLVFLWFGFLQIFNPGSTSIWYGLMGFKIFFYYVPMLFIGYALINSEDQLRRFFTANVYLALTIISLGIAQSILGASFLNPAVPAEELRGLSNLYRVSASGSVAYRPTSVFVSAGRYSNFIMVAFLLVLGFGGYLLLRQKRGRALAFIAIAVAATGAVLTTSRGSFLWGIINTVATSVAFIWGAPWRQGEVLRILRAIQRSALAIGLGIVLLFYLYPDALLSRLSIYEETLSPSSPAYELSNRGWDYPLQNFLATFGYDRWPYGYGIGTTSLGTQYVARFFHAQPPVPGVESGFGALVLEMGIGGLLLWLVMSVAITVQAWNVVKKLRGSVLFPLAFVIFWYAWFLLFPATFGGIQTYEDFLLNAYFWLLLGILFRLPTIAVSTQSAAAAQLPQTCSPRMR